MKKLSTYIAATILLAFTIVGSASADSPMRDQAGKADKAMDFSIANLPSGGEGLVLGMGLGTFLDANALAVGVAYGKGPLGLTLGIAATDDKEVAVGVSISWKLW